MTRPNDDAARAKLLARDLVFELQLYYTDDIDAASPGLSSIVDERRRFFQSQVPSEQHAVLEDALSASRLATWALRPGGAYRAPPPSAPPQPAREPESQATARFVAGWIISLLLIGAYWYLLMSTI